MMAPDLALQTAIRAALIAEPVIAEYVPADRIRAGMIRDEELPAIILAPARVEMLGRGSGGQVSARIRIMVNCWAVEDGSDIPFSIPAGVMRALMDAPRGDGFWIDPVNGWERPSLVWMQEVEAETTYLRAVISLDAVVTWKE